jgi:CheY-like chemotaxis protein
LALARRSRRSSQRLRKWPLALYFQRGAEIGVVLTDLSMGQMDGITLIRSLRRLNAGVRVIVSSAQLQKDNLAVLSGLGVKRFLHKPYSANQLLRTLQAVLADAPPKGR